MSLDEKHKLNIFVSENYDYINTNYSDRNINYLKNDISQYQIKGKIGEGMFGKVKLGIHLLTKEKVAIKIFDKRKIKNEKEKEYIKREISILKKLNHYNTIKLYNIIENENFIFLIQEYIPNGELLNFLEKTENLTEIYICKIYQQIISGIEYLYEIGIAHRDLKLENILLNDNKDIKIIDFGLSNKYNKENEELLQSSCGSPCYAAPEMIKGSKYHGVDTDIWSSGIILYLMLCKSFPFNDKNNSKLYQKILGGKFSLPNYLSNDVKDLLSKLLKVNPNERIKLNEIKKHPWFNLINQKKNYFFGIDTNKIIMPIDEDIIKYMKLFYGIEHNLIIDNILKNYENNITTIYNLLLQKKIRQGKKSIADFYSELYLEYINDEKNKLSYYNNDIELIIKNRINNINKKNKNIKNNFNFRKINPKVLKTKKNFNFYYNNQLKNISLNFSIKSHTIDNNNTSKSNSKKKKLYKSPDLTRFNTRKYLKNNNQNNVHTIENKRHINTISNNNNNLIHYLLLNKRKINNNNNKISMYNKSLDNKSKGIDNYIYNNYIKINNIRKKIYRTIDKDSNSPINTGIFTDQKKLDNSYYDNNKNRNRTIININKNNNDNTYRNYIINKNNNKKKNIINNLRLNYNTKNKRKILFSLSKQKDKNKKTKIKKASSFSIDLKLKNKTKNEYNIYTNRSKRKNVMKFVNKNFINKYDYCFTKINKNNKSLDL